MMRTRVGRTRVGRAVVAVTIATTSVVGFAASASADVSPQQQRNVEQGEQLVSKFLDLLHGPDTAGLAKFLSPAFLLQRANGEWSDKLGYLNDPAVVESYEIQDLWATRVGDNLVTRYQVVVDSTIDGQEQPTDPAPRMSVFVKGDRGWQLLAHSNFNAIAPAPEATS